MRALAAAAAPLLLAACLHGSPKPGPHEGEWAKVRDANTRTVKLYDDLAAIAFATATWDSPEVRAARIERTAEWKALSPQERAALQATEEANAARFDEFLVSMFTTEQDDNDLDAKQPSWRVAVVNGGTEALPVKIEQLRSDPQLRTLYPAIGNFDVVYRIRFPKQAGLGVQQPFTLRIAGPRGRLDFPFGGPVAAGAEPGRAQPGY